jgi:hypothetical protein
MMTCEIQNIDCWESRTGHVGACAPSMGSKIVFSKGEIYLLKENSDKIEDYIAIFSTYEMKDFWVEFLKDNSISTVNSSKTILGMFKAWYLEMVISSGDSENKIDILRDETCSFQVLERLSCDKDAIVRSFVARNQNASPELLNKLSNDSSEAVREEVAAWTDCPDVIIICGDR